MSRPRRHKLPTIAKVLGIEIPITYTRDLIEMEDGSEAHAIYEPDARRIQVAWSPSRPRMLQYLLHEIVHAHLKISGIANQIDPRLEETLCDCLENLLETGLLKFFPSPSWELISRP